MVAGHAPYPLAPVAEAISVALDRNIGPLANDLRSLQSNIERDRATTKADLDGFIRSTSDVLETRRRQIESLKTRNWIPLAVLLALALVLATAAITPWAMAQASGELLCKVAGGFWFTSTQNCTF